MDEKTLIKLQELFKHYDTHSDCIEEIFKLVVNKGHINEFYNLFQHRTKQLDSLGMNAIKTDNFEKLQGASGLYSMKFKSKDMNLRIIYSYKKNSLTLLLCCFYERSDSKDTYLKYIPIAEERKKEMEERHGKNY